MVGVCEVKAKEFPLYYLPAMTTSKRLNFPNLLLEMEMT